MSETTSITDKGIEVATQTVVSFSNMAEAIARADSHGQAEFFEHLAIALAGVTMGPGRWAMQCRAIAEDPGWLPLNRTRIAGQLETLAEHMREDVEHA